MPDVNQNFQNPEETALPLSPDDYKNKDLLNSDETAHWLGLKNAHTLEVWRSTKRYPELEYVRVGRCIRYRRKAIERFLEARTVSAEA